MIISFELKGGKRTNKNGTRTVRVYINHNGREYYTTKYAVKPQHWDYKRARIKEAAPNGQSWYSELIRLKNDIEGLCLKNPNLPAQDIAKLIGRKSIDNLNSFWNNFTRDCENGKQKRAISTVKKYREALGSIEKFDLKFNRRSDFDTINKDWYDSYTGYLRTERKVNETTIGDHIKLIKSIMRMAYEAGVSTNQEYCKKYFRVTHQESESIVLSPEEIKLLESVDLTNFEHLQGERDRFLIQYYFLLRFGDTLLINKTNVFEQGKKMFLRVISEKTTTETVLPINKKAMVILKKYNFVLQKTTNQEANWKLKEIGQEAGVDTLTTISGNMRKKYHFITTHTARRSGATHLYLEGLPIKDLSHLLGHASVGQTEEYIKVSKLESAKKALDYAFFK
jgi:site-specific recombinase XerD